MKGWTNERLALLEKLWEQKFSATEIASRLDAGLTRAAVLGMIHRLRKRGGDLKKQAAPPQRRRAATKISGVKHPHVPRKKFVAPSARAEIAPAPVAVVKPKVVIKGYNGREPAPLIAKAGPVRFRAADAGAVPFEDLAPDGGHWPSGGPAVADFVFCNAPKLAGKAYCEAHCRLAYVKPAHRVRDPEAHAPQSADAFFKLAAE